jgi:hypothetical protein
MKKIRLYTTLLLLLSINTCFSQVFSGKISYNNQALENVFPNEEPIENKKLGDVIRWVVNDVIKEEMDTMADNKIEPKDVNKHISSKVRDMFFKLV